MDSVACQLPLRKECLVALVTWYWLLVLVTTPVASDVVGRWNMSKQLLPSKQARFGKPWSALNYIVSSDFMLPSLAPGLISLFLIS